YRLDPAAPDGEHRPSGERDHGAPRPRLDPGLDRRADAVRPAARLPEHAAGTRGAPHARGLHRHRRLGPRLVVLLRPLHHLPAQSMVRRRGECRERLWVRGLPKLTGNHSHFSTTMRMLDGGVDATVVMGLNA